MPHLKLQFGALVPSIIDQLRKAGFEAISEDEYKRWQQDADAIVRLQVRKLLPDVEVRKARLRLLKQIVTTLEEGLGDD